MISMERFGSTWWGRLWTRALEELSDDFENRLPEAKNMPRKALFRIFKYVQAKLKHACTDEKPIQ